MNEEVSAKNVTLPLIDEQWKIVLSYFTISLFLIIVSVSFIYKLNIRKILKYSLSISEHFAIFLSIFAVLLSFKYIFNPNIEFPWQWELYAIFLTFNSINLPKKIAGKSDETLNVIFCAAITFIIWLGIKVIQYLGERFIDLFSNPQAEIIILNFIIILLISLIAFVIFSTGYLLSLLLPFKLVTKNGVSEEKVKFFLGQNMFLLVIYSELIGNYVFYPTLLLLIFLDKKVFKKSPVEALSKAEEKFYIISSHSKELNKKIVIYSIVFYFNLLAFNINTATNSPFFWFQLLSIIALFLLIFYYTILIFYSEKIKALYLIITDFIGDAFFVLICLYWYFNLNGLPFVQTILTNIHWRTGVLDFDMQMTNNSVLVVQYVAKYYLLCESLIFFPRVISDFCKFNFYKSRILNEKQRFFNYIIIFNIIYIFVVLFPRVILGKLSVLFGLYNEMQFEISEMSLWQIR